MFYLFNNFWDLFFFFCPFNILQLIFPMIIDNQSFIGEYKLLFPNKAIYKLICVCLSTNKFDPIRAILLKVTIYFPALLPTYWINGLMIESNKIPQLYSIVPVCPKYLNSLFTYKYCLRWLFWKLYCSDIGLYKWSS